MTVEEMIETYQKREESYKQQIMLQNKIIENLTEMNKRMEQICKNQEKDIEQMKAQLNILGKKINKQGRKKYRGK